MLPTDNAIWLDYDRDGHLDLYTGNPAFGDDMVSANLWTAGMADIDNDGDLDLVTSRPHFLFLNRGDGLFENATAQSGIQSGFIGLAFGDYDGDGFLDVLIGGSGLQERNPTRLYRNNGNDNHFLQVELVGTQSNRSVIGARVVARAGDLEQTRQILGGRGFEQDQLAVHFGLGQHTQVDQLEIHWPAGRVDMLNNIAADQKIRIVEGQEGYGAVEVVRWTATDELLASARGNVQAQVRVPLFDANAQIKTVAADLSDLGGPPSVDLSADADGVYQLSFNFAVDVPSGWKDLSILIEQNTALGPYWTRLIKKVAVLPAGDLAISNEGLAPGWQLERTEEIENIDLQHTTTYRDISAAAIQANPATVASSWQVAWKATTPVELLGYQTLHFAFHPGDVAAQFINNFGVFINDSFIDLIQGDIKIDLTLPAWQVVQLPLELFELNGPIESIQITGNLKGTFLVDDMRLIPDPSAVPTAVQENAARLPNSFALAQNYPNPFNSSTTIRFAVPQRTATTLAVFNMAEQKVATLTTGIRQAGTHELSWNGRNANGEAAASGLYFYRLQSGTQTRKLLLLK